MGRPALPGLRMASYAIARLSSPLAFKSFLQFPPVGR